MIGIIYFALAIFHYFFQVVSKAIALKFAPLLSDYVGSAMKFLVIYFSLHQRSIYFYVYFPYYLPTDVYILFEAERIQERLPMGYTVDTIFAV